VTAVRSTANIDPEKIEYLCNADIEEEKASIIPTQITHPIVMYIGWICDSGFACQQDAEQQPEWQRQQDCGHIYLISTGSYP
jgi:hypothetical protein